MPYLFINRYCKVTANIPERGIINLVGWITFADEQMLLIMDEYINQTSINREHLIGSIVVLEDQKSEPDRQINDNAKNGTKLNEVKSRSTAGRHIIKEICEVGN